MWEVSGNFPTVSVNECIYILPIEWKDSLSILIIKNKSVSLLPWPPCTCAGLQTNHPPVYIVNVLPGCCSPGQVVDAGPGGMHTWLWVISLAQWAHYLTAPCFRFHVYKIEVIFLRVVTRTKWISVFGVVLCSSWAGRGILECPHCLLGTQTQKHTCNACSGKLM